MLSRPRSKPGQQLTSMGRESMAPSLSTNGGNFISSHSSAVAGLCFFQQLLDRFAVKYRIAVEQ